MKNDKPYMGTVGHFQFVEGTVGGPVAVRRDAYMQASVARYTLTRPIVMCLCERYASDPFVGAQPSSDTHRLVAQHVWCGARRRVCI
jgi:hypothetical protein